MFSSIQQTADRYAKFYYEFAMQCWSSMTPMQYTGLLISIAVVGWLLMKSGVK
jgi:hypothetical protein